MTGAMSRAAPRLQDKIRGWQAHLAICDIDQAAKLTRAGVRASGGSGAFASHGVSRRGKRREGRERAWGIEG